ncbi:hypothetical protein B0T21DRAFT_352157 [Apiosordaria backusii]|uniref:Extracellular membrane protein CFEM domain-containing protein n=1 Tax=Apiosordaria backusii TaxID=314023 RepID=A0AA40AE40_9PEZI|nr:hypothetical protein B0T21DRAFT_352157 [Apiosordaria backusii]
MKLSVTLIGVLCGTFAAAAPSSLRTGLVVGEDPPKLDAAPAAKKQPLKSTCNNECLEKNYVAAGCAHAHDWMCLCVEYADGSWDVAGAVAECFLMNCRDTEDAASSSGISKVHCGRDVRAQAKENVWGRLRDQIEEANKKEKEKEKSQE